MAPACIYDVVTALAAARTRHPDLDLIVTRSMREPYVLRAKTVYLDGQPRPNDACDALLAGLDELDSVYASCPVVPLLRHRGRLRTG